MPQSRQTIGPSKELSKLSNELLQIEKRIDALRESIRTAETELIREEDQSLAPREDVLVTRIVDGVFSRLATSHRINLPTFV